MNPDWCEVLQKSTDPRLVVLATSQIVEPFSIQPRNHSSCIYLCDAYLRSVEEQGREVVGGYQLGQWVNIDHHAPTLRMSRMISSTPLAIERVRQVGTALKDDIVAINHHDCDSVLSAAIMLGILPPHEVFGQAAINADHTGQQNAIADLLQSIAKAKDFAFSLGNLVKLSTAQPLDDQAQVWLTQHLQDREKAKDVVTQGDFRTLPGGLVWGELEARIEGAFFPALLPKAKLILIVSPLTGTTNKRMSLRLGLAAPEGVTINTLNIPTLDSAYGGRWNAGSNNRAGGTSVAPQEYARALDARLAQLMPD